jgi:glycosyltransferase involved in cell wall biosynthesis
MATSNGAEFLDEQLGSIAGQSRPPAELVVTDDCSADDTPAVVERFATSAGFPVRFVRNETNLGFGANFMKAARLSQGDVIAWSDQDDFWMPDKLEVCAAEFERDPEVTLVAHSCQIGDLVRNGRLGRERPVIRGVRRREVHTPTSLPLWPVAPGHACLVSRRVLEIGDELDARRPGSFARFSGHDTWMICLAAAMGKVVLLPDVLVRYRQHRSQVAGAKLAPTTPSTRITASAALSPSEIERDLEPLVNIGFFRAELLEALAELLGEKDALARGAMWRRYAELLQRRIELWRQRPASRPAATSLARNVMSGDYGRRERGGLGPSSLARDLLRVADITHRNPA